MRAETLTASQSRETRSLVAECLGTLLLVLFGVGSAVLAGEYVGSLGIALGFGLTLLALACALGPISGCHLNPAVTLGMLMAGRMVTATAVRYWVAQVAGAILGAALLFLLAKQVPGLDTDERFGSNGYGDRSAVGMGTFGALVTEILLTFLLVYVWLTVTRGARMYGLAAVPVGVTLVVVQVVGIPLTGASANPARSIGPALFATGAALTQLWLFLVAPLVGAALAAVAHRFTHPYGRRPAAPAGEAAPDA